MTAMILRIVLFLLPFALFFIWLKIYQGRKSGAGEDDGLDPEVERRLKMAAISAILLSLGLILYVVFSSEATRGRDYVPPKVIDGKVEPGHFKDKDENGGD
ncbi:MAG: hypothetical protein V3R73_04375 [Sphingomonadales bacterium]